MLSLSLFIYIYIYIYICVCASVCSIGLIYINIDKYIEGARGVMVIVVGNGQGDTSSNPG